MRQIVRWIATGIFVLFWGVGGVGFLQANIAAWAATEHYDIFFATFLGWVGTRMPDLTFLLTNHSFWIIAGTVTGFAAGVWLDVLVKRQSKTLGQGLIDPSDICVRFPTKDWNLPLKTVFKQPYRHKMVKIDGQEFIECVFDHVTVVFDGTRPARITDCKRSPDITIESGNPIVVNTFEILAAFGLINKPERGVRKIDERDLDA
ncbi:hypothetical protein [Rhodopila sp.]|uniref:hypothetical protein n=1 Tax=Rhodopila sp. TaxID=2480087 RepID=UPI003D0B31F4